LVLNDLTLGYDGHPAVHHLEGRFLPGSLTAVVGPNGSGKSTLLKGITGALKPLGGSIDRGGLAPRQIAYLPQSAEIDRTFPSTVADLVALGHWARRGLFRAITGPDYQAMRDVLTAVGLAGFEHRTLETLSGGQLQRALFARLMLQDARVVLLDEPFAAVDERTTADLLNLVARWHAEGRTVIAVLHDIEQVRRHFPETLLLARRVLSWGPTAEALRPVLLQEAGALAGAWHDHAPVCTTEAGP
jgi:zinc/manganese transport system ATP-binding protein